jgi:hypothetical protein
MHAAALLLFVAGSAPQIDLYTMGPGDDVFSRFGHAAMCVTDEQTPDDPRCFNYGTTDFTTPTKVVWDFLRGKGRFWVSEVALSGMLRDYRDEQDRTLWVQHLTPAIGDDAARAIREQLDGDFGDPARSYYLYHHYRDNCTTRLRNAIDAATGGKLRDATRASSGQTFRQLSLLGFHDSIPLQIAVAMLLGRGADARATVWEQMFLPDVLRAEIAKVYGVEPELVSTRQHPVPDGNPHRGGWLLWGLALLLGVAVAFLPRMLGLRAGLVLAGLVLGVLALLFDGLRIVSSLPELHTNELVLIFWPTDLFVAALPVRWLRAYAGSRVVALALASILSVFGALRQPLASPIAIALLPMLAAWYRSSRAAGSPADARGRDRALQEVPAARSVPE